MNQLEENRRKSKEIEQNQIKLISKYIYQQRKRFDYADTAHHILEDKNETDLIFISNTINEWHSKAKEENKGVFLEIILALFRVQSYCTTMQTICKGAVAKYVTEEKNLSRLESEIRLLKLELISKDNEIKKLNEEIEFINKTSGK